LVIVAVFVGIAAIAQLGSLVFTNQPIDGASRAAVPSEEQVGEHAALGIAALNEGAHHRAASHFQTACDLAARIGTVPTNERRRLEQLGRQAELLADLSQESLHEILRHSIGLPEDEWTEVVRTRYRGRSIVLDDQFARDAVGSCRHSQRIQVLGRNGRIDFGHLKALSDTPLLNPQRVLLGFRILEIRRGADGWTIVPEPDSGVLLTDAEVFAGLSVPLDNEIREVLKRQRSWLESRP
jgi:hypothetical protein